MLGDTYFLIFHKNNIIGYTTSWKEADDICQKHPNLMWDSLEIYSQEKKIECKLPTDLEQLTIQTQLLNLIS